MRVEPQIWVANMLAKEGVYSRNGRSALRYDALGTALAQVADEAVILGASVHLPRIGTEAAGAQRGEIESRLEQQLAGRGIPVTVYQ